MNDNKLSKHLKRAVSKFESRPILRCVHYDANGSLAILYRIRQNQK